MYEARLGAFEYTIERQLADSGSRSWQWRVFLAGDVVAEGESTRSHAHAETEAQSFIFLAEAKERGDHARSARPAAAIR